MSKSIVGIAKSPNQVEDTLYELQTNGGISAAEISVLMPDTGGTPEVGAVKATKAPEGATTGAVTGGAIGGTVGLLAGIGTLAIPGLGPFIAAGPIMAALSGAAAGATAGGVVGALVGLGIPEYEAKAYEDKKGDCSRYHEGQWSRGHFVGLGKIASPSQRNHPGKGTPLSKFWCGAM
jgi:hypothetical protein